MSTQRNYWPLGIIITFGFFFLGMATAVVIATTHREHLVSENYYEQELNFQSRIDASARAKAAGAKLWYEAGPGRVELVLPGVGSAQKVSGQVTFYRADAPKLDRVFTLEPDAQGLQNFDGKQFVAGPWSVRVAWTVADKSFFLEEKMILPGR